MRLRNRIPTRLLAGFGIMCLLLLAAGCSGTDPQDTLNPQGHIAAVTKGLFMPVFWIAVAVFVFVEGLLLYALVPLPDHLQPFGPIPVLGLLFFRGFGNALPIASRTIRRCTLSFLATPRIVPIPNSYSRRICSNNSTLALQSNESPPFGQCPNQSTRSLEGGPKQTAELGQIRIPKSAAGTRPDGPRRSVNSALPLPHSGVHPAADS